MTHNKYSYALIYLSVCSILHAISADEACDESKCPGPIAYYESLQCIPIYESGDSCCAIKYNCAHLKERSTDKCYLGDSIYELGEALKEEDALPCDIECTCASGLGGVASFVCAVVDCLHGPPKPGCYRKNSVFECCPGEEVCPKHPDERARCVVDGKEYRDGESFKPDSDPTLDCVCQAGYEGKNVAPFCVGNRNYCRPELRNAYNLYNNCTPVYYTTQNPATDCSIFSRCQNENDSVLESGDNADDDADATCQFGNLQMKIGDELNNATNYSSVCVKCVCEVPPYPTCQRLPDNECDVTVHLKFDEFSKKLNNNVINKSSLTTFMFWNLG